MGGSMSYRSVLLAAIGLGAVGSLVGPAPPALAACHSFTVEVEPSSVAEGAAVTVTVRRDAGVGPSQIDIETVDGSARGGSDYEAVARRTVSFAGETEQSFEVVTLDDPESESSETFRLHLSNPDGCSVNPNFVLGPDAEVTITDNDVPDTTAVPPPLSTASPRSTTTTTSEAAPAVSTSTTAAAPVDDPATTNPTTTTIAEVDEATSSTAGDGDEVPVAAVAAAVVVALAVVGGGVWTWRRRTGGH